MHDRSGDGLDDHPDLADLRWSKREGRRALKRTRPRPAVTFPRRPRATVLWLCGLAALVAVGAILVAGTDHPARSVDVARPFAGTPVARWREGAAGIVAPKAVAVGDYAAEEVAGAYAAVRQLLITARLDRTVIVKHDLEPYLRQLAPDARPALRDAVAKDPAAAYGHVTDISGDFRLLPARPRVNGWMKAELAKDGALLVRTDYVVAYAFQPGPDPVVDPMDIVAVERLAADIEVSDDRWPPARRGLWPLDVEGYAYSMACTPYDDGVLAPAYSERRNTEVDAGDDVERMYDPRSPMPTGSGCPR